jgi:hypothetical protein
VSERPQRVDVAWNWVIKIGCFGLFIHTGLTGGPFHIAFLSIAVAALPIADLRVLLRSWRRGNGNGSA